MPNKIYNNYHKKCVFKIICDKLRDLDLNEIKGLKTQNGNTQNSERITINIVKNILDKLNFNYTEASSQQPYDFRNAPSFSFIWAEQNFKKCKKNES